MGCLNGPVIGNGDADDGDLGHRHLKVFTNAFQRITLGRNERSLQHIIFSREPQFQVGPHDRAGKALNVLIGLLERGNAPP